MGGKPEPTPEPGEVSAEPPKSIDPPAEGATGPPKFDTKKWKESLSVEFEELSDNQRVKLKGIEDKCAAPKLDTAGKNGITKMGMSSGIQPLVFDDMFARMKDVTPADARRALRPLYEGDDLTLSSYQRERRRLEAEEKATLPGRRLKGKVEVESVTDTLTEEEKKNRADIAMLLKLNGSVTIDFASGDQVDPVDPIAAERRKFEWTLQDVSADGL